MTQLELARKNKTSSVLRKAAATEPVSIDLIKKGISKGSIVLPANKKHKNLHNPCLIGEGLKTKVNANIGTSESCKNINIELKKLKTCLQYKADAVMDLSIGGNLSLIRKAIINKSPIPVGTVPIYEAAVNAQKRKKTIEDITFDEMLEVIDKQSEEGVDFFTIHAGVTRGALKALDDSKRLTGIVSRGGALMAKWIRANKKENPFYENFEKLIDVLKKNDVTISLGDGLRPGSIADATDKAQLTELSILGKLAKMALRKGCQVMIEGPGHIPINQIQKNMIIQKNKCSNVPFYVLGPLVTDIGAGYDHITSAIGGALAAYYGASFLCYVTPSEHLGLPDCDDVKTGIIASKIAAHAADIARGLKDATALDNKISKYRKQRKWKEQIRLSMDPERSKKIYNRAKPNAEDICSMCGEFCPMKIS